MPNRPKEEASEHRFWDKQPVPHRDDAEESKVVEGPIDEIKTVDQVQKEPYGLPAGYEWFSPDVNDENQLNEIFELLRDHYVEDDDQMFRFCYPKNFVKWALTPPGWVSDWHVGVRVQKTGKIVALITGIPGELKVKEATMKMAEINFLCVHKKIRSKRLAPVLIKEVTRRVNLQNIWQAVYTAGIRLPGQVSSCLYYHRSLNPEKLINIGFSRIPPSFQKFQRPMEQTKRHYRLPDKPQTPGFRPMETKDVEEVTALLNEYLEKFELRPIFSPEETAHWLLPREGVVYSYVVESEGKVTDFTSFYVLPSTVMKSEKYNLLTAAYSYYHVPRTVEFAKLINDLMTMAKSVGVDVMNMLNVMENQKIFNDCKFGPGDGNLQYYLYNWRTAPIEPNGIALVLL